jgi:hypothetical protein
MVTFEPINSGLVADVAMRMRDIDREEIEATVLHADPGMLAAALHGALGFVSLWRGRPVAVVFAQKLQPWFAGVGMFATDEWERVAQATTLRVRKKFIPELLAEGITYAECRSLISHVTAHRWLERFGYTKRGIVACGRQREQFVIFGMEAA